MATKEAFERAWFAQCSSASDGPSLPPPSLSCWDSAGNLRSQEALTVELERCRQRIAELRQKLRAEEFVEFFCQRELECHRGSGSRAIAKRSASHPFRSYSADVPSSSETAVQIEGIYSEPIDVRPSRVIHHHSEDLYTEPVDAKDLERVSSVPEPLYSLPVQSKPVSQTKRLLRPQRHVYEEIGDVRAEKANGGDNSSDDESYANLVALRQSMSRLSQWCVDGDAARRKLEIQAKRLSSRFVTCPGPLTNSGLRNNALDSVPECCSPPTPDCAGRQQNNSSKLAAQLHTSTTPSSCNNNFFKSLNTSIKCKYQYQC